VTGLNLANFLQLAVNGLVNGTSYALIGVGFGLILGVSGRFHIAFAVTYTIAAYAAAVLTTSYNWPFWIALIAAAAIAALVGALMERLIYLPLSLRALGAGSDPLLVMFVASLGLVVIGRNAIALAFLSQTSVNIAGFTNSGINVGPVTITTLDIWLLVVSWGLIVALTAVLNYTALGRMVRAVRANWEMSLCIGIDPSIIFVVVFAIGSFLSGVAGVFQGTLTSATPDLGLPPLFYALVVAFVAGLTSSPLRVALLGLALGELEAMSSLFLPTQFAPLVVFAILFIYVALRPVKFSDLRRNLTRSKSPPQTVPG
jgi:branched-subunit amino acid ABC-type transport system permease component